MFSDEWQAALSLPPALEYFKMAEANSLRGQFDRSRGWDEGKRDARVLLLAGIAQKYASLAAYVSISHADFAARLAAIPLPQRRLSSDRPYSVLALQLAITIGRLQHELDSQGRIEFIFDQQVGFDEELLLWWPLLKETAAEGGIAGKYDGALPVFRDEKEVLPLQAADLYAWQIRRHLTDGRVLWAPQSPALLVLDQIPAIGVNVSDEVLALIGASVSQQVERFVRLNPNAPLLTAGKKN